MWSVVFMLIRKKDRKCRVDNICDWISCNVFQWMARMIGAHMHKIDNNIQRQTSSKGGWHYALMLVMPNELLTCRLLPKPYKAHDDVSLLTKCYVPIAALNLGLPFTFQQVNAPIHRSKLITDFFAMSSIKTLNWSPCSPDINI